MKRNVLVASVFIFLTLLYFHNAFTEGLLLARGDSLIYFYPVMSVVAEQYKNAVLPLWNSYIFSGFPLMASSQHGVFYPPHIVLILLFPLHLAYNLDVVLHIALAGFLTFLYTKKIGNGDLPSFMAGVVFAFLGYLMAHLKHLSILHTAVWLPLILYFFEDLRLKADPRSALFASLPIALQIFAGHPQVYFYTYMVLFIYVLFHSFYARADVRVRFTALCFGSLALGLIIGSPQLFATYELSSFGVRQTLNYEFFSSHNFPLRMMHSFIFPMRPEAYNGALPLLLAAATFWVARKSSVHVRFWGVVAAVSLILALGDDIRPLNKLMFHVPVYNMFRGVSKHILEFDFAISVLFALGLSFIIHGGKARKYITALTVLLLAVILISFIAFFISGPSKLFTPAVYRPLAVMSVSFLCLLALHKSRRYGIFKYLFLAVVFLEVMSFRVAEWPQASTVNKFGSFGSGTFGYMAKKGYRAAFLTRDMNSQLVSMYYGLSTVEGYDPLIMRDYKILLDMGLEGYTSYRWRRLLDNSVILSLLNTRYIVISSRFDGYYPPYRKLFGDPYFSIYENPDCMPRAWSVSELLVSDSIHEIKAALYTDEIDPRHQAVVSKADTGEIGTNRFSLGNVEILKYEHSRVVLKTEFNDKGFVILSDQYYPGWKAYIDGKPTKIYKTFGVLRGVVVPEGEHELVFRYLPVKIYILLVVSILTVLCITVALVLKKPLR